MAFRNRLLLKFLQTRETALRFGINVPNILTTIFFIYDNYEFDFQLTDRLNRENMNLTIDISDRFGKNQEIVVSETQIKYLLNYSFFEKLKTTYLRLFVLMEHFIVQLIIILWGKDFEIPHELSFQNNLHDCLMGTFFKSESIPELKINYSKFNIDVDLFFEKYQHIENISLMSNWANSCYLDSLLFVLLVGDDRYIKNILFNTDPSRLTYENREKMFKNPTLQPITDTLEKSRIYTEKIQKILIEDFLKIFITENENFKCRNIRNLLFLADPKMKEGEKYVSYTPSEVYSVLCRLFPKLNYDASYISSSKNKEKVNMFSMYEFIEDVEESSGKRWLWDELNSDFLVFQTSVYPRILNYGYPAGVKKKIYPKYSKEGELTLYSKKINTVRYFSEYILDGKYRLFGAVRVHGLVPIDPSEHGGGHYSAYIRPFFNNKNWYYYNDITPEFENLGEDLPKDTFLDREHSRSEMLFYTKV